MKDKKKIAIILPSTLPVPATLGGAIETNIQLLIDENEKHKKLHITIVSTWEKKAFLLSKKYIYTDFLWIKRETIYKLINFFFRAARKVFKNIDHLDSEIIKYNIRKEKYDKIIIEGNTTYLTNLSKVVNKEKLVLYVHANIFGRSTVENKKLVKIPGKIVTVSEFIKQEIIKHTNVDKRKIIVIKNPIDYYLFNRIKEIPKSDFKIAKGIMPNETVLLFVGRIVEDKGVKVLLKALLLLDVNIKFKLFVIGSFGSGFGAKDQSDSFSVQIKSLASKLGGKVIFEGFVHNTKLPEYYKMADIVIMPSLCDEAAGKVAMEGMTSSVPVITTKAGGIPEYVNDKSGLLLDRDDKLIINLANAIKKLIYNSELRKKMGNEGRKTSFEFRPERYYFDYVNLVNEYNN